VEEVGEEVEVVEVVGIFHLYFYPDIEEVGFGACESLINIIRDSPFSFCRTFEVLNFLP